MSKELQISVVHTKKLQLREPTLKTALQNIKSLDGWKVTQKYHTSNDPDEIDPSKVRELVKLENPKSDTIFDQLVKSIHIRQISQYMKHMEALDSFISNDSCNYLLVLEDDILTSNQIKKDLTEALQAFISSDADVLSLSCPIPKGLQTNMKCTNLFEFFRFLPSSDAYLVKKNSARVIRSNLMPMRFQFNIQLSYICTMQKLKLYLHVPNIFVNGSKFGVFLSSVDPNNKLFMNSDYNKLVSILSNDSLTSENKNEVQTIIDSNSFKEHPDFLHLYANFFRRIGNIKKAKELYDHAYKIYTENDCILSAESEFLTNYTRIFQHLQ